MIANHARQAPYFLPVQKSKWSNTSVLFCQSAALLLLLTQGAVAELEEDMANSLDAQTLLSDDNLLIVDVYLGKYRLARDVFVYADAETTLVPLQPLFDAIEFPILVDSTKQTAEGWFLKESNTFNLADSTLRLIANKLTKTLELNAPLVSDGYDLYASVNQLNEWFPLTLELQKGRLRLIVVTDEPLPLEKKLEREKERQRLQQATSGALGTLIADRYQLLGSPVIDVQLGSELSEEIDTDGVEKSMQSDFSRSLFLSADIFGFQSSFSSSQLSKNSAPEERLTLYKRPNSPKQNLPWGIGYAALGDVFGASDSLVFSGDQGRGIDIEFGVARRSSDFGKRVLEGELEPGWEVEVYRNGVFLGFQIATSDGRYHFDDVPVEYGENNFELRFYGPLGQEEVRRESINVGEQALPAGETYARLSYVNVDRMLFGNNYSRSASNISELPSSELKQTLNEPKEQKLQLSVQRGISDRVSASLALANHLNATETRQDHQYIQAGLSLSLPRAIVDTQFAKQRQGGLASLLSAQSQISGVAVSLLQKRFDNYDSDRNENKRLKRVSELRLSGIAKLPADKNIAYSVSANQEINRLGTHSSSLQSNIGFGFVGGRMNLETSWLKKSTASYRSLGTASYIRHLGAKTSLRWSMNYALRPSAKPTSLSTSILWRAKEKFYSQLVFSSDFGERSSNNLGVALNYKFPRVTISSAMLISSTGKPSLQVSADFSLAKEHKGRWAVNADSMANEGRLRARVFLDHDYDGAFSASDEPVDGVKFLGRHSWKKKHTNSEGIVYLSGLRTDAQSSVALERKSLADPYWRSEFVEAHIVSHPGGLQQLDVPIQVTVEAEGSLYVQGVSAPLPLAGIPIEIKDDKGDIVAASITEFDGYFLAEGLIPGKYSLHISSEALSKFAISSADQHEFSISSAQGVYQFSPIVLSPDSESQE